MSRSLDVHPVLSRPLSGSSLSCLITPRGIRLVTIWGSCSYSVDLADLMIFPVAFVWDLHFLFLSLSYAETAVSLIDSRRSYPTNWSARLPGFGSLSSISIALWAVFHGAVKRQSRCGDLIPFPSNCVAPPSISISTPRFFTPFREKRGKKSGILRKCIGTMLAFRVSSKVVLALLSGAFTYSFPRAVA